MNRRNFLKAIGIASVFPTSLLTPTGHLGELHLKNDNIILFHLPPLPAYYFDIVKIREQIERIMRVEYFSDFTRNPN